MLTIVTQHCSYLMEQYLPKRPRCTVTKNDNLSVSDDILGYYAVGPVSLGVRSRPIPSTHSLFLRPNNPLSPFESDSGRTEHFWNLVVSLVLPNHNRNPRSIPDHSISQYCIALHVLSLDESPVMYRSPKCRLGFNLPLWQFLYCGQNRSGQE